MSSDLSRRKYLGAVGGGALAVAGALSAPAAFADGSSNTQLASTSAKPKIVSYDQLSVPGPQSPTASRPYYQYDFDAGMKAQHPEFSPLDLQVLETDKLVVYNYIDQSHQSSMEQTALLEKA